MQGYRLSVLMSAFVLLALAGCNSKPQPSAAPVPDAAIGKAAPHPPTNNEVVIPVVLGDHEIYHTAVNKDTITWQSDHPFTVTFKKNENPCEPAQDTQDGNSYDSGDSSSPDGVYSASCTVKTNQTKHLFVYNVSPDPDPPGTAKPKPGKHLPNHCKGCVIDITQ